MRRIQRGQDKRRFSGVRWRGRHDHLRGPPNRGRSVWLLARGGKNRGDPRSTVRIRYEPQIRTGQRISVAASGRRQRAADGWVDPLEWRCDSAVIGRSGMVVRLFERDPYRAIFRLRFAAKAPVADVLHRSAGIPSGADCRRANVLLSTQRHGEAGAVCGPVLDGSCSLPGPQSGHAGPRRHRSRQPLQGTRSERWMVRRGGYEQVCDVRRSGGPSAPECV